MAVVLVATGAAPPDSAAASSESPVLSATAASGLVAPVLAGLSLGLPFAVGALVLRVTLRSRRNQPVCPVCSSRRGARVGQVGAHRNGYRCHTCGFLWELPGPIHSDARHH